MRCNKCGGKTRWDDVGHNSELNESYRHRVCDDCGHVIYTCEMEVEANEQFMKHFYKCKNAKRKEKR